MRESEDRNVRVTITPTRAHPAPQVHWTEEVEQMASVASAIVVNIGTLSEAWGRGMIAAARKAQEMRKPWVLDPVAVGLSPARKHVRQRFGLNLRCSCKCVFNQCRMKGSIALRQYDRGLTLLQICDDLLACRPTIVCGNASEIMALAGQDAGTCKGPDATATSDQALDAATSLARRLECVVAVTGKKDYVSDVLLNAGQTT